MDTQIDTAQRRVEATAIQLCEKWFEAGARASWCPAMANDFAQALQQARRDVLEEAVKVVNDYNLSHDHGKKATEAVDNVLLKLYARIAELEADARAAQIEEGE